MINRVVFNWGSRSLNALLWRKLYYLLGNKKFIFQNVEHISANTYTETRSPSHLLRNKTNQNFIYRLWKKKKRKSCENFKNIQGRKTFFSKHVTKCVSSFKCQIHGTFKWYSVLLKIIPSNSLISLQSINISDTIQKILLLFCRIANWLKQLNSYTLFSLERRPN